MTPSAKKSQLARLYEALEKAVRINTKALEEVNEVLGEAQNGPPDGAADGSIDETTWNQAREAYVALCSADAHTLRALRQCTGTKSSPMGRTHAFEQEDG